MNKKDLLGRRQFLKGSVGAIGVKSMLNAEAGRDSATPADEAPNGTKRQTISLNGEWRSADSVAPDEIPGHFEHTVPVPGLGQQTFWFDVEAPRETGYYLLKALTETTRADSNSPTLSRRKVSVIA